MLEILENEIVRLMLALIVQAGLSWPLRTLQSKQNRHLYSFIWGSLLQFYVYGMEMFPIMLYGVIFYFITVKFPKYSGGIVTYSSMLILSLYYLRVYIYRYGDNTMDEVVLMMIMVCRYSQFAYSYSDGQNPQNSHNKELMICESVSLFQYMGYLQFLPTAVMGPPIEYNVYKKYMNREGNFQKIPSPLATLQQNLKETLIIGAIYGAGTAIFPLPYLREDQFYERSCLFVGLYSALSITVCRFKYYTAWKIGIASVHSSGVSYREGVSFDTIEHCRPWIVETSPHIKQKIGNWNIMVQEWLRKCIYERSPFKSKMGSQLHVFMVSAFWHGLYAGYYISFFLWFAQVYLQNLIYKYTQVKGNKLTPLYKSLGEKGPVLLVLLVNFFFSHNATFFYLLDLQFCFKLMKKMHYLPQLLLFIGIGLFSYLGRRAGKGKQF